jgi:hypothetical protein
MKCLNRLTSPVKCMSSIRVATDAVYDAKSSLHGERQGDRSPASAALSVADKLHAQRFNNGLWRTSHRLSGWQRAALEIQSFCQCHITVSSAAYLCQFLLRNDRNIVAGIVPSTRRRLDVCHMT